MAPKTDDRRVQRTQRALHDAFFALVVEKDYEAITVQDILDRANVGRSTFYQHFAGKQDLLLKGLENLRGWLAARHREVAEASAIPGVGFSRAMFEHVGEGSKIYRAFVGKEGGPLVQRELQRMLAELVRSDLAARAPRSTKVPLDLLAEFAASAFMATLAWWMEQRTPMSASEID